MAIKPIQGMLKKHLLTNLSIAIGGGVVSGYAWWYTYHVPKVQKRDAWYLEYQKTKEQA
ncbi:Cytochrome c oxidase subunit 7A [Microbotryomycetes sp. JL221]|nr:Cytochrome c oxidase subunit 7A [Microbotryomycetes sp. JL221]